MWRPGWKTENSSNSEKRCKAVVYNKKDKIHSYLREKLKNNNKTNN